MMALASPSDRLFDTKLDTKLDTDCPPYEWHLFPPVPVPDVTSPLFSWLAHGYTIQYYERNDAGTRMYKLFLPLWF